VGEDIILSEVRVGDFLWEGKNALRAVFYLKKHYLSGSDKTGYWRVVLPITATSRVFVRDSFCC